MNHLFSLALVAVWLKWYHIVSMLILFQIYVLLFYNPWLLGLLIFHKILLRFFVCLFVCLFNLLFISMFSVVWKIFYCSHLQFLWSNASSICFSPQSFIIIYLCLYTISFIRFFTYINHIFIVYSTYVLVLLISSFVFLYFLNPKKVGGSGGSICPPFWLFQNCVFYRVIEDLPFDDFWYHHKLLVSSYINIELVLREILRMVKLTLPPSEKTTFK